MTKDVFIKEVRDAEAMLYHISKSILKNDSDCGDAVQETILKAYEKLPTLKKEKYFRTWITRILINECKGILRKRKNVIPYEEYMDNMRLTEEDSYSHLYMAIMELPEDLRILVTLYYLEGFSLKEISEALEIPEGTIKSRLSRAREFLKVQLSEEEKSILDSVIEKLGRMSKTEIIKFMHKEKAYISTAPRDVIQIQYAESQQI